MSAVGKDYDSMEKVLFIPGSYHEDKQKATRSISFWKGAMIKAFFDVDVHDPRKIEENGQVVGDDIMKYVTCCIKRKRGYREASGIC